MRDFLLIKYWPQVGRVIAPPKLNVPDRDPRTNKGTKPSICSADGGNEGCPECLDVGSSVRLGKGPGRLEKRSARWRGYDFSVVAGHDVDDHCGI